MESLLLVMVVLALTYLIRPCICTGVCSSSTHDFGLSKDGAFHFPLFHMKHPCVDHPSSPIHTASVSDAGAVIGNDRIHEGKYFMAISLGTPATFSTIDTGSTLSWVQCQRCEIFCHNQVQAAGRIFDPHNL